jgi:hypothetical protein
MDIGHNLGADGADAADRRVEIGCFKPQDKAVADGLLRISDRAVMVTGVKPVQLHDEVPIDEQLLILGAAVAAASPEHLLIPPARRLDVRDGDHRLRPHGRNSLVGHAARLSAASQPGLDKSDACTGYRSPGRSRRGTLPATRSLLLLRARASLATSSR